MSGVIKVDNLNIEQYQNEIAFSNYTITTDTNNKEQYSYTGRSVLDTNKIYADDNFELRTIANENIQLRYAGEDFKVIATAPPGYNDSTEKYPMVFVLPGLGYVSDDTEFGGGFPFGHLTSVESPFSKSSKRGLYTNTPNAVEYKKFIWVFINMTADDNDTIYEEGMTSNHKIPNLISKLMNTVVPKLKVDTANMFCFGSSTGGACALAHLPYGTFSRFKKILCCSSGVRSKYNSFEYWTLALNESNKAFTDCSYYRMMQNFFKDPTINLQIRLINAPDDFVYDVSENQEFIKLAQNYGHDAKQILSPNDMSHTGVYEECVQDLKTFSLIEGREDMHFLQYFLA